MKLALLPIWLALPMLAQVRATFEPLADAETKRTTGVKDLTLWNVTVESNQASVNRGDVERLTAFTELRPSMAEDMIRKSSGADGRTLAGKGWDGIAPLGGPLLLSWGISATNYWSIGIGGVVTVGNVVRGLLKGQAPEGTMYLPEFMPDVMACKSGYCGNWLVLTSKIGKPEKVEVGALLSQQFGIGVGVESKFPILGAASVAVPLADRQNRVISRDYLASESPRHEALPPLLAARSGDTVERALKEGSAHGEPAPIVTHPQIPDEDEARALQIAAWVRERSAMGAGN